MSKQLKRNSLLGKEYLNDKLLSGESWYSLKTQYHLVGEPLLPENYRERESKHKRVSKLQIQPRQGSVVNIATLQTQSDAEFRVGALYAKADEFALKLTEKSRNVIFNIGVEEHPYFYWRKPNSDSQIMIGNETFLLPKQLAYLTEIINDTKYIFDLEENWDEDGGLKVKEDVLYKSLMFVFDNAKYLYSNFNLLIIQPEISPCPDGSVDVLWKNENGRILFNFRNNLLGEVHFYGDDYSDNFQLKGSFIYKKVIIDYLAVFLKMLCKG